MIEIKDNKLYCLISGVPLLSGTPILTEVINDCYNLLNVNNDFINYEEFSTGDVAKLLNVSVTTVLNWIKKEYIISHNIPYSLHRRILRKDLINFIKSNNYSCVVKNFFRKGEI